MSDSDRALIRLNSASESKDEMKATSHHEEHALLPQLSCDQSVEDMSASYSPPETPKTGRCLSSQSFLLEDADDGICLEKS